MGQCDLLLLESLRRLWNSLVLISKVSLQRSQSGSNCSFEEPVFAQTWEPWLCFQPHLRDPISGLRSRWSTAGWCRIPMSRRRLWWPQWRPWAPHQFKSNSRRSHRVQFSQCRWSSRWWQGCKGMMSYRGEWRWIMVSCHQKPVTRLYSFTFHVVPSCFLVWICIDSSYSNVTCSFVFLLLPQRYRAVPWGLQSFTHLVVVWCPFLRWCADDADTQGPHAARAG